MCRSKYSIGGSLRGGGGLIVSVSVRKRMGERARRWGGIVNDLLWV